jgi:hypothetical protein
MRIKTTSLIIILLIISANQFYSQNFNWAVNFGGEQDEFSSDMDTDAEGNIYIVGNFIGNDVDFDPGTGTYLMSSVGGSDLFFAKFDSLGNFIWAKSVGGSNDDIGARIKVDDYGNLYITGWFQSYNVDFNPGTGINLISTNGMTDIFVAKYDTDGDYTWAFNIGSSLSEGGHDITIDNDENVYITGYFYGSNVDFNPDTGIELLSSEGNSGDIFVSSYSTDGDFICAFSLSGQEYEVGNGIEVDNSGNIIITGLFQNTVDFDPSGTIFNLTSIGGYDIFLAKYDTEGNYIFAHSFGQTYDDIGSDIVTDSEGNVIFICNFQGQSVDFDPGQGIVNLNSNGGYDIAFAKYTTSGDLVWVKSIGGFQDDFGVKIITDSENNVYHTGAFAGNQVDFNPGMETNYLNSFGSDDIYIAKYDNSGNYLWAGNMGGSNSDFGNSISLSNSGQVFSTGSFSSTNADFNPGSGTYILSSNGNNDIFVGSYNQNINGINEDLNNTELILDKIYPNPANSNVFITYTILKKTDIEITIYTQSYDIEKKFYINPGNIGTYTYSIDMSEMSPGFYFINIKTELGEIIRKIELIK